MRNKMIPSTNKFSKRDKAKTPSGWMAFDHHQRHKHHVSEPGNASEAYPMLSGSDAPKSLINKNTSLLKKPFSSVVVPNDCPYLMETKNIGSASEVSLEDYQNRLNYFHPWPDESLIEDILAGVNNNVDATISLIEAMFNSGNEGIDIEKVESSGNDFDSFGTQGTSVIVNRDMNFVTSVPSEYEGSSVLVLDSARSIPAEPEWEEDDVYLVHRKDAIKAKRSASRHSKAANDAYIKGDHISARRYSRIAEQEWIMAKKLNTKAAKEILTIRNCKNDLWTLDLHGLHAVEAVDALHDRLQTVESPVPLNCFTMLDGVPKESGLRVGSVQPKNHIKMDKFRKHPPSTRPRQNFLQVITGKGNHSKGAAALPSAVRNFLYENGYHFDETRPGMFMIQPKFRKQ